MSQQLLMLATLSEEDPSLVLRTHLVTQSSVTSVLGHPMHSSGLYGARYSCSTCIYMQMEHTYTKIKTNKNILK